MKLLCENGANINAQGEWGHTALHNCIEFNYQDCAKYLLEMGASIDIVNIDGDKPLDIAKNLCSKEIIDLIFEYSK